jgi:hypothetical protein
MAATSVTATAIPVRAVVRLRIGAGSSGLVLLIDMAAVIPVL